MRRFGFFTRDYAAFFGSWSEDLSMKGSLESSTTEAALLVLPRARMRLSPIFAWIPRYSPTSSVTARAILVWRKPDIFRRSATECNHCKDVESWVSDIEKYNNIIVSYFWCNARKITTSWQHEQQFQFLS